MADLHMLLSTASLPGHVASMLMKSERFSMPNPMDFVWANLSSLLGALRAYTLYSKFGSRRETIIMTIVGFIFGWLYILVSLFVGPSVENPSSGRLFASV